MRFREICFRERSIDRIFFQNIKFSNKKIVISLINIFSSLRNIGTIDINIYPVPPPGDREPEVLN